MFKRAALLIILISTAALVSALDPDNPIDNYLLDEWGPDKGFLSDTVYAIVQTPDGYLWFGTSKGLVRYDGVKFETIVVDDSLPPRERWVGAVLVDKQGILWFSGQHGLTRCENGEFKTFTTKDGLSGDVIMTMAEDSYGSIWLGTYGNYLSRCQDGKFTVFNDSNGLEAKYVSTLCEDTGGVLWVGSRLQGLFYKKGDIFEKYRLPGFEKKLSVSTLYVDRKNRLWIGTDRGLVGMTNPLSDDKRAIVYTTENGLIDNNIWSILEDGNNNLWVGTGRALHRLKTEQNGDVSIDRRLFNAMIPYLFEDREKSLWIGTFRFGLKRLRDGVIKTLFTEEGIPPYKLALYKDRSGVIWLGSIFGDLYRYSGGAFSKFLHSGNINMEISAICEDRDGHLWFGTTSRGVFQVIGGKAINRCTAGDDRSNFHINVIFCDSRGKIRVGTEGGGMLGYENGAFVSYTTKNGLSGDVVTNIYEDRENNIWVGTAGGIDVMKNGGWKSKKKKTFLSGHTIYAIHEDADPKGIFWIGTNSGLARFNLNDGNSVFYTVENGLSSNDIFQILEDSRGNFWLSSFDGIIKVAKKELEDFAEGRTTKITSMLFGLSDGMLNVQCMISARNSAIKVRENEFWFATQKGISVVSPEKIPINKYPPGVVIEKALFNGEPVPVKNGRKIFKGIKNARFYFTAPTFISPGKVKVFYKLDGLEKGWNTVEPFRERTAYYTNLPPGDYRFHVTAANSDGIRNESGATFEFTSEQYFYETLWFRIAFLLVALAASAAAFFAIRRYLYLRELKNKYKHSTLDPQKAEQALKKLRYLLEVKKVFKDENLSQQSLAARLLISPRYLSQVMNERLNKNFWELVNGYRIKEAKNMLKESRESRDQGQKDYSILEIGLEVGFSSKVVFNRVFKKHTGMTPTQFRSKSRSDQ
jgi:ligand-binding sensor domain-containing protein/AraC-like DNA-binding protein